MKTRNNDPVQISSKQNRVQDQSSITRERTDSFGFVWKISEEYYLPQDYTFKKI